MIRQNNSRQVGKRLVVELDNFKIIISLSKLSHEAHGHDRDLSHPKERDGERAFHYGVQRCFSNLFSLFLINMPLLTELKSGSISSKSVVTVINQLGSVGSNFFTVSLY